MSARAAFALLLCHLFWTSSSDAGPQSGTLRVATLNTELSRKGPGLLLRDLRRGDDQIRAVVGTIVEAGADILALQGFDWDYDLDSLRALQHRLKGAGQDYPYAFAVRPNSGLASGLDLDGDGRLAEPEDSWGWGQFTGQSGIALLSKYPIAEARVVNLTDMLWKDLQGHRMPVTPDGTPYPDAKTAAQLRLSSTNHWAVPVTLENGQFLWILSFHAAPPVFDGAEDRNGRRNADEILIWTYLLDGTLKAQIPDPFVLMGDANNDPDRGEGHNDAITRLLHHPRLQDVTPSDEAGQHSVIWDSTGPMRVDYVLPSAGLSVVGSGILRSNGSRHGLIWVDIRR